MIASPHLVTFAGSSYLPVLLNWLLFLRKASRLSPHIVALDRDLYEFLSSRGFSTTFHGHDGSRTGLWKIRTEVFADLIRKGKQFIHSDTDAIWLNDPWPLIAATKADISVSQGTVWPYDTAATRGFVGCCGFFHAACNPRTQQFFDALADHTRITADDQISMNHLFDEFDVRWDRRDTPSYTRSYQGRQFTCFEDTILGISQKTGLTVALLPHHRFQRLHMPSRPAHVKHLLNTGSQVSLQTYLNREGYWLLDDRWRAMKFDSSSIEALMRKPASFPANPPEITGSAGGAWTAKTHTALYPNVFNNGLARFLANNFAAHKILEFGSGMGDLARFLSDNAPCSTVDCIEPLIMPTELTINTKIRQFALDIFQAPLPEALCKCYDLVISIEVAEHIDRRHHSKLFDFLVARCNNWLVFSGARVGQGGHGHIAERPEEEWRAEITSRGLTFCEDLTAAARLACDAKNVNHRRNLMVFRKPTADAITRLTTS